MDQYSMNTTNAPLFTWVLGAAALGALAMYMLDPVQGNRRRALARDKMIGAQVKAREMIDTQTRDLANRARGLQAEASRMLQTRKSQFGSQAY